ncbi:hypothetical protein M1C59_18780 [Gordonia terrae]|uniref:hypothetical protein n=1 Tax=Gordonia terrae TaxID=2055 RepID=UPI00200A1A50|nr:hypothetical protein [Gordonia terrae]UPW08084.1 hypothetical protein M1C59_18780 [Gordonia terrae]
MSAQTAEGDLHRLEITLAPSAGTAGLLRVVSALHGRGAQVLELRFGHTPDGDARLDASIVSAPARVDHLVQTCLNAIQVTDVRLLRSAVHTA